MRSLLERKEDSQMTDYEKCVICGKHTPQKIVGITRYFVITECLICGFKNTTRKDSLDKEKKDENS